MFEDVLKRFFCKYKLSGVSRGENAPDFFGNEESGELLELFGEDQGEWKSHFLE